MKLDVQSILKLQNEGKNKMNANRWTPPTVAAREPVVPEITAADKVTFWNFLNDVQYGVFDENALEKLNTWVFGSNGKWLVQKSKAGYFGVQKSNEGIDTLPLLPLEEAFVSMKYGKMPQLILDQILKFFRAVMEKHSNSEAFCQIYWDLTEAKYIIHVPKQKVSGAAVHYEAMKNLDKVDPDRYVFVYECHSHNNMNAFWSGTDNADENDLRLYGVFGKLGRDDWEHKQRAIVGEEQLDLRLDTVFDVEIAEPTYNVDMRSIDGAPSASAVVPRSSISKNEVERFDVALPEGEVVTVEKNDIQKIETEEVVIPEEWFAQVNKQGTPIPSIYSGQRNFSQRSNSPFIPQAEEKEETESLRSSINSIEEIKINDALDDLSDFTNCFEDVGACAYIFEEMESKDMLSNLAMTLNHFTGVYADSEYYADMETLPEDRDQGDLNWDGDTPITEDQQEMFKNAV
jgi:PRTRC genetic system protein A